MFNLINYIKKQIIEHLKKKKKFDEIICFIVNTKQYIIICILQLPKMIPCVLIGCKMKWLINNYSTVNKDAVS